MSAKAKSKIKNHESKLAEAIAIAGAAEAAPPELGTAQAAPSEVGTTPTDVEPTPTAAESTVGSVAPGEAPSRVPLAVRARIATSKAVVNVFASVRSAQTKAVQKSLAWITATDTRISKSLLAGERFLLGRLRVTLE